MRLIWTILVLLAFNTTKAQTDLISNGDFAIPNYGWITSGNFFYDARFSVYHSFPGYAYLSNSNGSAGNYLSGSLQEYLYAPPNTVSANLTFWYRITTQEDFSYSYDRCYVNIKDGNTGQILWSTFLSNLNANSQYQFYSVIIPASIIQGRLIILEFNGQTDGVNPTVFRIDDVSFIVDQSCVSWPQGTPTNPELLQATEFLCSRNIIDHYQSLAITNYLARMVDIAQLGCQMLFGANTPLPTDYYPNCFSDLDDVNPQEKKWLLAMLFYENGDGVSVFSRDYFRILGYSAPSKGKALRALLEMFNVPPDLNGYDKYSIGKSNFLCDVLQNDEYYGYYRKAFNLGILNGFIYNCSNCGGINCLNTSGSFTLADIYILMYRLAIIFPNININPNPFYIPNNVTISNLENSPSIDRAAFKTYENGIIDVPSAGPGLNFSIVYQSDWSDIPVTNYDVFPGNGTIYNLLLRQRIFPLGLLWTHSYNAVIVNIITAARTTDSLYYIKWGDGSVNVFNYKTSKYVTKGIYDELQIESYDNQNSASVISIKKKDQTVFRFKKSNSAPEVFDLIEIVDRNGNKISLSYEAGITFYDNNILYSGPTRLKQVLDKSSNRSLIFYYQDGTNIIDHISDPSGRTFYFSVNRYTENLEGYINGNNGLTKYIYGTTEETKNLLTSIQKPKGNTITNTYFSRRLKSSQNNQYKVDVSFTPTYLSTGLSSQTILNVTAQAGQQYIIQYDHDEMGNIKKIISQTQNLAYEYNDTNNPTLPTKTTDQNTNIVVTNTYDIKGNALVTQRQASNITTAENYSYNSFNDVTVYKDAKGNSTFYNYDSKGNLINKILPSLDTTTYQYNPNGTISRVSDAGVMTDLHYNTFGNLDSIKILGTSISASATFDQLSRISVIRNPNGRSDQIKYDPNDNILEKTEDIQSLKIKRTYVYDPNDNLFQIKNARSTSTFLDYDFNTDDLIRERFGAFTREWSYNTDGTVKTYKNKNGNVFNYQYYPAGNPLESFLQSDGFTNYSYDNQTKRLQQISLANSNYKYSYDAFGRIIEVFYSSPAHTVKYEYDDNDQITKIIYPDGKFIAYVYDASNRLIQINSSWRGMIKQYSYKNTRLQQEVNGNGTKTNYIYDIAGRLISIFHQKPNGDTLAYYAAALDESGNHTQETRRESFNPSPDDLPLNPITTYQYDTINRLTAANGVSLKYDANGNLTNYGSNVFTYDVYDRLLNTPTDIFEYDPLQNRRRKNNTRYVIDAINGNDILMETDLTGNAKTLFIYGNGLECRYDYASDSLYYYHSDFRGSITNITNQSGIVANWYSYGTFGELLKQNERFVQPFKYVGKHGVVYDNDSLYFMQARYYNPKIGRFMGEDPVWSTNLYSYTNNNSINYVDPSGLLSTKQILINSWNQSVSRLKQTFLDPNTYRVALGWALLLADGGGFTGDAVSTGGRLGSASTRALNFNIGTQLERQGSSIIGGAGRLPEEYLRPLNGGRIGGSYVDITAIKNGEIIRINTVDTYKNGLPTLRELQNAERIKLQTGKYPTLIPKR